MANPVDAYLSTLSRSSARIQRYALLRVLRLLRVPMDIEEYPWWRLSPEQIANVRQQLEYAYSPATANLSLSALRRVLLHCRRLDLIDADTYYQVSDFPCVNVSAAEPTDLPPEQIQAMFAACAGYGDEWMQHRNAAVLALVVVAGLRKSEAAQLRMDQLDLDTGEIRVNRGNHELITQMPNEATETIRRWVQGYRPMIRKAKRSRNEPKEMRCEKVLLSARHGRPNAGMTPSGVHYVLQQLQRRAK